MSELYEYRVVKCPYTIAREYLAKDMTDRADTRRSETLALRAQIAGGEVAKDVVVRYTLAADPMHFDQPWGVRWTPNGGGPYPDFEGELTVRADEDYKTALLELRGRYVPPGGALGAAFDRVVGSKIASATAQSLLADIAAGMEARFARAERAKHQKA